MINLTPSPLSAAFGLESPFCSPPVKKTESACALAVPVDSGQAGGIPSTPSIYAAFRGNHPLWVSAIRKIHLARDEVFLLHDTDRLSSVSWAQCDIALRDKLNVLVKEAVEYGFLLFLVDES